MDLTSTIFTFIICLALANSGTIRKLETITEKVKLIETDINSNAYIITSTDSNDRLYALDPQNAITFTMDFINIVSLKLNRQNQLYIFDVSSVDIFYRQNINLWLFDPTTNTISNPLNYTTPTVDNIAFFDEDNNLFFDSVYGISILQHDKTVPVIITDLDSYNIKNPLTHAVDQDGNVILGIRYQSPEYDAVIIIAKEEISKPNPTPYFVNLNSKGEILEIAAFNDSIYFATVDHLVQFKNDYANDIFYSQGVTFSNLHATNEKLFFRFRAQYCFLNCLTLDEKIIDFAYFDDCTNIFQTFDEEGNGFFGVSYPQSEVYALSYNETGATVLDIPNTLYIYGLAASDKGDLWVLAQNLYVVPNGSISAVKVPGLPFVSEARPIKTKPGTDDVYIGLDDGLYIATV